MRFKVWMGINSAVTPKESMFSRLMREVSKDDLAKIGSRVNKFTRQELDDEPFNDIFGKKYRIVIPIAEQQERNFLNFLISNGLKDVDVIKGTGVMTTQTDRGPKPQEINIGKFLKRAKSEWLDYWVKNREKMGRPDREGVSIIISRHPIDIVRMSDHSEWSSCHSPGNSFYQCALQEARTGGAIAYVVRNRDLSRVRNLQAKDIFKDDDRGIDGIEPLERLRLRRFDDDKNNYLVPELRTYGIKNVDFYDTVKDWAITTQKNKLEKVDYSKLNLRGGSYQDNQADELWSGFLGTTVHGKKSSLDQTGTSKGNLEHTVEEAVRGHTYKHFWVDAAVGDHDGQQIIFYSAGIAYKFPLSEFIELPVGHAQKQELGNSIRKTLDIYTIEEVDFAKHENNFYVQIRLRDEEDNNTLEQLEQFLDYIDRIDGAYEKQHLTVWHILWEEGYIYNPAADLELQNFTFDDSTSKSGVPEYSYESKVQTVGSLAGLPEELVYAPGGRLYDPREMKDSRYSINNKITELIAEKIGSADWMDGLYVRIYADQSKDPWGGDYHTGEPLRTHDDNPVLFSVAFGIEKITPEALKHVQEIDKQFPQLVELAKQWWEKLRQEYLQGIDDPGEHPATKHAIQTLQNTVNTLTGNVYNYGGKISLKKGEDGKLVYWYQANDPNSGIDMPAKDALPILRRDSAIAKNFQTQFSHVFARGDVFFKYVQGKPQFYWSDENNNVSPADEALAKAKAEYERKWGKR